MKAKEYRQIARESLNGKWGIAVGAGLIASILGGTLTGSNSGGSVSFDTSNFDWALGDTAYMNQSVDQSLYGVDETFWGIFGVIMFIVSVWSLIAFILGPVTKLGYATFNKNLYEKKDAKIADLFGEYDNFIKSFGMSILILIYTLLWTLLFIIPGIIAGYSYSMAYFILRDNPDMSAHEAISASKEMMKGHKWELFCLEISFIGWMILSCFTMGIGFLFLTPYMEAAIYAFYRTVSGIAKTNGRTPEIIENYSSQEASEQSVANAAPEIVDVPAEEAPVVENTLDTEE